MMTIDGYGISSQREDLTRDALAKADMTHLLWIDEEMEFSPDCLHISARRRQSIGAANYRMRVPPADLTALKLDKLKIVTYSSAAHAGEKSIDLRTLGPKFMRWLACKRLCYRNRDLLRRRNLWTHR